MSSSTKSKLNLLNSFACFLKFHSYTTAKLQMTRVVSKRSRIRNELKKRINLLKQSKFFLCL